MDQTTSKITLYGRPGCLMVRPVARILDEAAAEYEYVDIWQDPQGRQVVQRINGGHESVPTLVFPDGSTLTEPGEGLLRHKLSRLGYDIETEVPFINQVRGWLRNPVVLIVFILLVFYLLRWLDIF